MPDDKWDRLLAIVEPRVHDPLHEIAEEVEQTGLCRDHGEAYDVTCMIVAVLLRESASCR